MENIQDFIVLGSTISQSDSKCFFPGLWNVKCSVILETRHRVGFCLHIIPQPPPWLLTDQEIEAKTGKATCSRWEGWQVAEPRI